MDEFENLDEFSLFDEEDTVSEGGFDSFGGEEQETSQPEINSDNDEFENYTSSEQEESEGLPKKLIIAGVVVILAVLLAMNIYGSIKNKNNKKEKVTSSQEASEVVENNEKAEEKPVDSVVYTDYIEIDGKDEISLNEEKSNASFTVTSIKHLAKTQGNELRVKTVISGSLSGLSGTYDIEIPYSLGRNLSIGATFDVYIKLGEFSGKTVVEEIAY